MLRRAINAGIDGLRIDVEAIQLLQDFTLVGDRDSLDLDPVLAAFGHVCVVAVQKEGAGLRFDAKIGLLGLHAED